MPPESSPPSLSTPPPPGFVETFNNREARWRALAGVWETTPNGVHVMPGRVAAWYVCRVVRPPDYALIDVTLTARAAQAGATAAAAVSIITDQGHRALSAALDVKNNRLLLMGMSTDIIAEAPLPEPLDPDAHHTIRIGRNGPTLTAELNGVSVRGSLRRSITGGLLAFWTDPGVEAVYRRLSMARGFVDEPPFSSIPADWEPVRDAAGWSATPDGLRYEGANGVLAKRAGAWTDVQVRLDITPPDGPAQAGVCLLDGDGNPATTVGAGQSRTLTVRRQGPVLHVWHDDAYRGARPAPEGPAPLALVATGPATFHRVSVTQWV